MFHFENNWHSECIMLNKNNEYNIKKGGGHDMEKKRAQKRPSIHQTLLDADLNFSIKCLFTKKKVTKNKNTKLMEKLQIYSREER